MNETDDLFLRSDGDDDAFIAKLADVAAQYDMLAHGGRRLTCHLMLQSNRALRMLQTCDFCDAVRQKLDVYPFTQDELWCQTIVPDYESITLQSDKHVHVVVFGMGEVAEMVAIQQSHIAHFPNYVRNHSLRTRITMIDSEASLKYEDFINRYQHLFDNSYYRVVKPSEAKAVVKFHKPMYEGSREDFVDVEWEFVEAEFENADLREKLKLWANDKHQLLTVVLTANDRNQNQSRSLLLPQALYEQHIPVFVYGQNVFDSDAISPYIRMAKNVNYIYNLCYNENVENWTGQLRYAVEIDVEERERLWAKLPIVKRMSSIYNAMTIPVKMRSVGLNEEDWDKFYDLSPQDIELLAQVEHNRWCVEELILGFRPCTDAEQDEIAADVAAHKEAYKAHKVHYDLRAYNDLRPDKTGKSVTVYDLCLSSCLPLIAKEEMKEKGGEQ